MSESQAYASVVDMTYTADFDVFSLRVRDIVLDDVSLTALGREGDDYAAFDNAEPGRLVAATFHGDNETAVGILVDVFDDEFKVATQAMRDGARLYEQETTHAAMVVPYTNSRRLARIALHADSQTAPNAIRELAARVA